VPGMNLKETILLYEQCHDHLIGVLYTFEGVVIAEPTLMRLMTRWVADG
jgi:hypothetical protein